ncbi:unnamed protein product [Phyllotreta striolata]|uniref:3-dehydrosphinganine reductase n=1 Tax=Phyllotreta striolata TaxID=444603 RepID=A0A9N9THX8_PHYSR|nr:unnamed protein product [Phyllotreta striolata]
MHAIWFLAFLPVFLIVLYIKPSPKKSIKGKHVVIIGGSSGIGRSTARVAAKTGAHVTIMARNKDKLEETKKYLNSQLRSNEQIITTVSVDVSNYEDLEKCLNDVELEIGPIYMLINCAGLAICGNVEDFSLQQIKQLVDINFLGSLYSVKAVVPKFKERQEGIIVLTGSQVSLMGMFGYSVYSSTKFALRGLAESLYMEVKPYNISVTLALPPDTDTPGFENENKTKPLETKLISEVGGLVDPDVVAERLMQDALTGKFFSYVGMESFILTTLCTGMSPFKRIIDVLVESALLGLLRIISAFYITSFESIIKKCKSEKEASNKEKSN